MIHFYFMCDITICMLIQCFLFMRNSLLKFLGFLDGWSRILNFFRTLSLRRVFYLIEIFCEIYQEPPFAFKSTRSLHLLKRFFSQKYQGPPFGLHKYQKPPFSLKNTIQLHCKPLSNFT